jgi:hypothetical protein
MLVVLGDPGFLQDSELKRSVREWRQSERKKMIDTIEDLIQSSHKAAKSQYTQSAQRAKWTRLAGQLIWYKDQMLRSMTLEAMEIELQMLEKKVMESNELKQRESMRRNFPTLVFHKPEEDKPEEGKGTEAAEEKG